MNGYHTTKCIAISKLEATYFTTFVGFPIITNMGSVGCMHLVCSKVQILDEHNVLLMKAWMLRMKFHCLDLRVLN